MKLSRNEVGQLNILLLPLVIACVILLGAIIFGSWAYMGRQDFKNNVDQKIQAATKVAVDNAESKKDNEFIEQEKIPTRTYQGSAILGSIVFDYPKTWSGYYDETDKKLALYMDKGLVTGTDRTTHLLKVEVLDSSYTDTLKRYEGDVKAGDLKASAYRLAKLPDVLGTRLDGKVTTSGARGSVVILPQREKTVKISTETEDGLGDFNNIILPSFVFTP